MTGAALRKMDEPLPANKQALISVQVLKVVTLGRLAKIVLDTNEHSINRLNAKVMLYNRLREYNGAMWVGASLHERADVIRVLREYPE